MKNKFKSTILREVFTDYLMFLVIISIITFIAGYSYVFFVKTLIIVYLIVYAFQQFVIKQFILSDQELIVEYPMSFLIKSKTIRLDEVEKIIFRSSSTIYDPDTLEIIHNNGSKKKFLFSGRKKHQELIDELRKLRIEVITESPWK